MPDETAKLLLNIFDGARQLIDPDLEVLITVRDGHQNMLHQGYLKGQSFDFTVPFYNNLGDDYAVIVSAPHYQQVGFHPIHVNKEVPQTLDLMLLPKPTSFDFSSATWDALGNTHTELRELLAAGSADPAEAEARYNQLMDNQPGALACLLNITTAMDQVHLPHGGPLDYLKEFIWTGLKSPKQDRFFAYADGALLDEVKQAAAHGEFSPEPLPDFFHPGATKSYKQNQFGEANLQLSFHEHDVKEIDHVNYMMIEADIDYYKDPIAHALLEVIPNHFHGPTDPIQAYVLRWIAGRHAGVPEFEPPYTIEPEAA